MYLKAFLTNATDEQIIEIKEYIATEIKHNSKLDLKDNTMNVLFFDDDIYDDMHSIFLTLSTKFVDVLFTIYIDDYDSYSFDKTYYRSGSYYSYNRVFTLPTPSAELMSGIEDCFETETRYETFVRDDETASRFAHPQYV